MAEDNNSQALQPDSDAIIPRMRMSEIGITGLRKLGNQIQQEANYLFRYPSFLKVVNEMKNNQTVASVLLANRTLVGNVDWYVEPPPNATPEQIERSKFIETCMHDMDHTWSSFISEAFTYLEYGFAVHEKVFRRRLRKNGSKYDDGLIGIQKLPTRHQSTIFKWLWSDNGRELIGLEQSLAYMYSPQILQLANTMGTRIRIDRDKFILFSCDSQQYNPEGRSILKGAYTAYKRLQMLQDHLMIGVARDLGGIPVFKLPPDYLDPNLPAGDGKKAAADMIQKIGENIATGSQSYVMLPQVVDPETKKELFTFELMSSSGGKNFDVAGIARQFQNDILAAMCASVLEIPGASGLSNSVIEGKTTLLAMHLKFRCKEIAETIVDDLVRQLYALNGWTDTEFPKIKFTDFAGASLEEISKYLQRVSAVGLVEAERDMFNLVREHIGLEPLPADKKVDPDMITSNFGNSRSGDGLAAGGINGTSKNAPTSDNSANNADNSA